MTFPPSGQLVQIYKCETVYENFDGREGTFKREGDRYFCVLLNEHDANILIEKGVNVKVLPGSEDDYFIMIKHRDFGAVQWYGDLNIEVALTPYRVEFGNEIRSGVTVNLNRIL